MSSQPDITKKTRTATKWADCRIESENRAIADRAYVTHEVHRHNDCGEKPEEIIPEMQI